MTHVFIIRFEEKNYHCMMDRKREREGKRIFNYKGLLTQYQNLRYLAEGIQSTVWEKRINVSTCMVASYIIMVERKYTIGPKKLTESERSQVKYY